MKTKLLLLTLAMLLAGKTYSQNLYYANPNKYTEIKQISYIDTTGKAYTAVDTLINYKKLISEVRASEKELTIVKSELEYLKQELITVQNERDSVLNELRLSRLYLYKCEKERLRITLYLKKLIHSDL